jgi:hypothetical protein
MAVALGVVSITKAILILWIVSISITYARHIPVGLLSLQPAYLIASLCGVTTLS